MRLVNNENKARRIVIIKQLIILKFHLKRNDYECLGVWRGRLWEKGRKGRRGRIVPQFEMKIDFSSQF